MWPAIATINKLTRWSSTQAAANMQMGEVSLELALAFCQTAFCQKGITNIWLGLAVRTDVKWLGLHN